MLVHRFDPEIKLPIYGSSKAAGFDLALSVLVLPKAPHVQSVPVGFTQLDERRWQLHPGGLAYARSGLGFAIPDGHYLDIRGRSGWTGSALVVLNGVVDPDYTGEVGAHVINLGSWPVMLTKGMRIAQAVLTACAPHETFTEDENAWAALSTERGDKGFGASGA